MIDSILVVCVGNICRSPTGERLLKKILPEKTIASAGFAACCGKPADQTASEVAMGHGLSLDGHIARPMTSSLCRDADLILVMEKKHIRHLLWIHPTARGKTMLFGHWLNQQEIVDPYRKDREVFEQVYGLLEDSARKWGGVLSR